MGRLEPGDARPVYVFALVLRYVVTVAAVSVPLAVSLLVLSAWLVPAWEASAQEEFSAASQTKVESVVLGPSSLCPPEAPRCASMGLRVQLPSGEETLVRWKFGKPYNSTLTLWQHKEGVWTSSAPVLREPATTPAYASAGLFSGVLSVVIAVGLLSIRPRAWAELAPMFLRQSSQGEGTSSRWVPGGAPGGFVSTSSGTLGAQQ